MTEKCRFENFSVHRRIKKEIDGFTIHENVIKKDDRDYLFLHNLEECKDVANVLSVYHHNCVELMKENEQLKSEIEKLSYANEDLLSEKRNWQRMSDEYCKLSEENEQLKSELYFWKKQAKQCPMRSCNE